MRAKVVFFVLGALLATFAYFLGDIETLRADGGIGEFDGLKVRKGILIENEQGSIGLSVDENGAWIVLSAGTKKPQIDLGVTHETSVIDILSQGNYDDSIGALRFATKRPGGPWVSTLSLKDSAGKNGVTTLGSLK